MSHALRASQQLLGRIWRDEQGNEIVEYALLLGMIVCACILLISALGKRVLLRWERVYEMLDV